jgi:hypothetical protein
MAIKDFSPTPPRQGRRLRFSVHVYDPSRQGFRCVKGLAALVTVADAAEQARLWRAIEDAIGEGRWRHGDSGSSDGALRDSGVRV